MKKIGRDVSASDRWCEVAADYVSTIDSAYQRHRLDVIRALLPSPIGKTVIDFGCGDGILIHEAFARGAEIVIGLDINETMVAAASRIPSAQILHGGVDRLGGCGAADCLIAANVLAYMTDDEEDRFYRAASRIVRRGGSLVVTHSNALFDMFTLNARTTEFYRENFGVDPSPLLTQPDKPNRPSFNIRENPLSYRHKLARYGFHEDRQEYMNFHSLPPLLSNEDPDDMSNEKLRTLGWPEAERWKLAFQCSMFGVRAERI